MNTKHYIDGLQETIELYAAKMENAQYYIDNYSCRADDCSECHTNCPLEEWQNVVDNCEYKIFEYEMLIDEIQEGTEENEQKH